jgi:hypothetical protein
MLHEGQTAAARRLRAARSDEIGGFFPQEAHPKLILSRQPALDHAPSSRVLSRTLTLPPAAEQEGCPRSLCPHERLAQQSSSPRLAGSLRPSATARILVLCR